MSERLGQSFELVGKQLNAVQQGLGEMQTLAQDVGGLKKVLSNVKIRGGFGEVQLHMMLESILAPEQYEANQMQRHRQMFPIPMLTMTTKPAGPVSRSDWRMPVYPGRFIKMRLVLNQD